MFEEAPNRARPKLPKPTELRRIFAAYLPLLPMLPDLTPRDLHARQQRGENLQLIDVREQMEYDYCRIEGSHLIPLGELPRRTAEIATDRPVVLICHHGVRSMQALAFLQHRHGLSNLLNLKGGIDAWSREVDPGVPMY
ncbi:rhodanese-like domain-containing protein [Hymenobacter citatus]